MNIRLYTGDRLILEKSPPLLRLVFVSIAGAGVLLVLATMKEYGVQSWYRLTYWLGALVAVVAGAAYALWGESASLEASRVSERLLVRRRLGMRLAIDRNLSLRALRGVEVEDSPRGWRLVLLLDGGERLPVLQAYTRDEDATRAAARRLAAFIDPDTP
ncbi:MAG: hypothetical protein OHK0039_14420 [Bacteroidia bacterium]